ncbi:tripartite tricarboxylate transporter substrate binding protein [Blastococcus saxobsidens]|uniref:Tripartite-type tricarboxylate transporter receptor subunit TctC n=1 Tax=Blastococcus saxobsidens TaxID=138336 RepID=A0A4Q7YAE0_9ACTN|nr:tripartite tricarboxylate transporter substrate binding protein [Blastococcus saxobsidens]RZU34157.1 tripartite-type tricarboxylate transporter receptor subunit TctC [Blastococcus saxobsidens]
MTTRSTRARRLSILLVPMFAAVACGNAASSGGGGGDAEAPLAGERIRFIVPTSAGGGFDTTARQLQPYLEEALDATIVVENLEGGGYAIGTQAAINAGGDCKTILFHAVPHVTFSYLTQNVDYTIDDLAPLAGVSIEPGMYRVRDDAPWETMQDLIDDAKARPNEIRLSVSDLTTSNFVAVKQLQELTGADFNVVPYDGGGPARTALVAGEVDVTEAGVFNSLAIDDGTRVLAVNQPENQWPDVTDDAPTTSEALGMEVPSDASNYGMFAPASCEEENPEAYQALVDGVQTAMENPEFVSTLEKLGEADKLFYLSPEEYGDLAQESADEISGILEEDPDAFEVAN